MSEIVNSPRNIALNGIDELKNIISDAVDRFEMTRNIRDVFCSLRPMIDTWFDVVPEYIRGNISEKNIRRFARAWGSIHCTVQCLLSSVTTDEAPRESTVVFRDWFQSVWCPTNPTGNVYFILAPHSLSVKIGYTSNGCALRLLQLQTGTPEPLVLLGYMPADERYTEMFLHEHFRELRIRGEWFQFNHCIADFVRWACEKRAPDLTLNHIPEFSKDKWNCDPWPKGLPKSNKEIEAWLASPELY